MEEIMAAPQNVQYNETTGILSWDSTGAGAVYEIGINQTEEGVASNWHDYFDYFLFSKCTL